MGEMENGAAVSEGVLQVPPIGEEQIKNAVETLRKYKDGKKNLENRVINNEQWYKLRHWEELKKDEATPRPCSTSAWLHNTLVNKHADAMDNYPEPLALPREQSDEGSAKIISSVLPVIMEYCRFEKTYSRAWWEKLKHGWSVYGVFWDPEKENGLGDIDVRWVDPLKIFWEPGITDLQDSQNVFTVELVDNDVLTSQYPQLDGKLGTSGIEVSKYLYDDTVDTSGKSTVVDWYYKKPNDSGKSVLHYVHFVNDVVLYASENDPDCAQSGYYWHGKYPFHFDVLFPEKDTPTGFGYISICKDPQIYIDKLMDNILVKSLIDTKQRYFVSSSTNINKDEMLDLNCPGVQVEGEIDDRRVKEIVNAPLDSIYIAVAQMKIDEMKDTASNRDVSSGGTTSGVTAAAAISALQEAGNKASRDMIGASYLVHIDINDMCVELMRQFYTVQRTFRITNEMPYEYASIGSAILGDQLTGTDQQGNELYRRPVFDIKIKAQKKNPFSRAEQNERAKELYSMGFFSPERAQEALLALDMMDFEGIEKIKSKVSEGATLLNLLRQSQQQTAILANALAQIAPGVLASLGFTPEAVMQNETGGSGARTGQNAAAGGGFEKAYTNAQTPMTSYGDALAKRSAPDMSMGAAR